MVKIKERMRKSFLAVVIMMVMVSLTASSIEFRSENIGGRIEGLLLISYNDFFSEQTDQTIEINNYLSVSIVTNDHDIVYQEQFQVIMSINTDSLQGFRYLTLYDEYFPLKFSTEIEPDEYELIVTLNSHRTSQKRTYREKVNLPQEKKIIGSSLLVARIDDFMFAIRDNRYLIDRYDEIKLWQHYSETPDTTKIALSVDGKSKHVSVSEINELYDKLRGIDEFTIEVHNKYNEKTFNSEPVFPTISFFFQERFSPDQQLAQLRNILNHNEYRELRGLESDELQQGIDEYWNRLDPDIYSVDNYYQRVFYNRVIYADRNFGIKGYLEGWETDRGKIYIKYGPPDNISTDAFPIGRSPRITWHYYSINRTFNFYDLRGYGQYELREKWMD